MSTSDPSEGARPLHADDLAYVIARARALGAEDRDAVGPNAGRFTLEPEHGLDAQALAAGILALVYTDHETPSVLTDLDAKAIARAYADGWDA